MESPPRLQFSEKSLRLKPYAPIEPPAETAKRLGIAPEQILKLDANENPYGCHPGIFDAIREYSAHQIYPDPAQRKFRKLLAEWNGVQENQIVAGAGADEILDLICRLFLENGDAALTFSPTFSYYEHVIGLNGGSLISLPREEDFHIGIIPENTDLSLFKCVFLCAPNNPTGTPLLEEQLNFFLSKSRCVVLDEAYADFSENSFLEKVQKYNNLIVVKTFSKLFGLAGLRIGYAVSSPEIIEKLMRIKPPYSMTTAGEAALEFCLSNHEFFENQKDRLVQTREEWRKRCNQIEGVFCYPSEANFLLCRFEQKNALELKQRMEKRGILLRYFSHDLLSDCLRISVGKEEDTDRFFRTLEEELEKTELI